MIIEQVKHAQNIYDLLALCCKCLFDKVGKNTDIFWKFEEENVYDNVYDNAYDMIESYTCNIQDKGHKKAYELLIRDISLWFQVGASLEKLYFVIKCIDEQVENDIKCRASKIHGFWKYSSLNELCKDEVKVIPKIRDTFLQNEEGKFILMDPNHNEYSLFREPGECFASSIDELMNNYMIWDKRHLEQFPFTIFRVDEDSLLGKHFYHRKKVTIGIVPFTCRKIDDILNIQFEGKMFYIDNMKQEANDELKERYKNIYTRSRGKDIDFLVYPEMLMSEDIIDSITTEDLSKDGPKFIINGSIWSNYTNRTITTDLSGSKVFTYYKKCAFKYREKEKKYKEHLDSTLNREYVILEIIGFGRIGICICKDLTDENVLLFHKLIKTNILFVPAFSDSFQLENDAVSMASKYNCLTIFANSCAAYSAHWINDENYDIGFVMIPAKKDTRSDCYMEKYAAEKCLKFCDNCCNCKLFTLSFNKVRTYDDRFSVEIWNSDF